MRCRNGIFNTALRLARHHQRIGRDLTGRELQQRFQVAVKNLIGLSSESENHVDVADREKFLCFCNVFKNFLPCAELIALGHFQNAVIEALDPDRHTVYEALEHMDLRITHDLRIGLNRHFLDRRKQLFSQLQRFGELVHQHGRCTAADIHRREVISHGTNGFHFFAQIHKVFASLVLLEKESVESTVRTQRLAEGNMRVKHIFVSLLRERELLKYAAVKR